MAIAGLRWWRRQSPSKTRRTQRRPIEARLQGHPLRVNAADLPRRRFLHLAAGAAAVPAASRIAMAQTYPTRRVRVIVPYGTGGLTDVFARLVTQKLSERLGKQFYVENIPGAGSNIGTGQAARATPDGHTMLMTANSYVINPSFFDKVPYDPYKSFEPVMLAVANQTMLTVNSSVPAMTVKELIALIRANPGKYNFAATVGSASHLAFENLRRSLGLDIALVPYNGAGQVTAARGRRPRSGRHGGRLGDSGPPHPIRQLARARRNERDAVPEFARRSNLGGSRIPGNKG
jgi:hypothetical protein